MYKLIRHVKTFPLPFKA